MHADRAVTAWRTAVMDGRQNCLLRATIWTSCSTKTASKPFPGPAFMEKAWKIQTVAFSRVPDRSEVSPALANQRIDELVTKTWGGGSPTTASTPLPVWWLTNYQPSLSPRCHFFLLNTGKKTKTYPSVVVSSPSQGLPAPPDTKAHLSAPSCQGTAALEAAGG